MQSDDHPEISLIIKIEGEQDGLISLLPHRVPNTDINNRSDIFWEPCHPNVLDCVLIYWDQ